jgi:uncharacterized protein YecE (DUF72 family)
MTTAKLLAGASGYSFKEWKGVFYPEDIKADEMLPYYAEHLSTVEINNTFYRMPKPELLEKWAADTPEHFAFVLKAPQRLTHIKKLEDCASDLEYFLKSAESLGRKRGPILFQLPPWMKKDLGKLDRFLALLPEGARAAFEFRHATWFDDETYALLKARHATLAASETDEKTGAFGPPVLATTEWGYFRLRRTDYTEADLLAWIARIREQPWSEAWIFFKHEDEGNAATLAASLKSLL